MSKQQTQLRFTLGPPSQLRALHSRWQTDEWN